MKIKPRELQILLLEDFATMGQHSGHSPLTGFPKILNHRVKKITSHLPYNFPVRLGGKLPFRMTIRDERGSILNQFWTNNHKVRLSVEVPRGVYGQGSIYLSVKSNYGSGPAVEIELDVPHPHYEKGLGNEQEK